MDAENIPRSNMSAGLLFYRYKNSRLEVLLVHPGGPFWKNKDVWGIPKGEYFPDEDPLSVAKREFEEEIGQPAPTADYKPLDDIKVNSGKKSVKTWAAQADLDAGLVKSNTIRIEWPPRSGKKLEVPEVDKAAWLPAGTAVTKMHKGQEKLVVELAEKLGYSLQLDTKVQASLF